MFETFVYFDNFDTGVVLGMTYLHTAVAEADSENVRFLIKLGVDVNARTHVRQSAMALSKLASAASCLEVLYNPPHGTVLS